MSSEDTKGLLQGASQQGSDTPNTHGVLSFVGRYQCHWKPMPYSQQQSFVSVGMKQLANFAYCSSKNKRC